MKLDSVCVRPGIFSRGGFNAEEVCAGSEKVCEAEGAIYVLRKLCIGREHLSRAGQGTLHGAGIFPEMEGKICPPRRDKFSDGVVEVKSGIFCSFNFCFLSFMCSNLILTWDKGGGGDRSYQRSNSGMGKYSLLVIYL